MALAALAELEKHTSISTSSSSLADDYTSRLSTDSSDTNLNELDPLSHNGARRTNSHIKDTTSLLEKESQPPEFQAWRDYWHHGHTTLRAYIERFVPIDKIEHHPYARRIKRRLPSHVFRRARRKLGLTVPGRILGFIAISFATLVLLVIASGAFVYKKGTLNGQSPPWYPTPLGGTVKSWEASYEKAAGMVKRMTLAEKVNVTSGTGWMMGLCVGNTGPALESGFPSLCLQDGPLGLRFADHITASPAGLTVGATWNKELMYKRGKMMGAEAKRKGVNVILGPSVGALGKMPAGGRNFEGFGSDPVLQGVAAAQTVRGIQDEGVMATIKHFVGNEQEHFRQSFEWGLPNAISTQIDDRTLHEVYAWPFADAIRAGVASLMCSYNQVNNSYACQNSYLLNGIIKDEMGFQGFIQSDWLAQRSGVASTLSGLDMSMPGDGLLWAQGKPLWGHQLTKSILNGSVPLERINDMVTRVVAAWYQLGQDDVKKWPKPPPDGEGGPNFSSWTDDQIGRIHAGSDDQTTQIVNKFVDATTGSDFSHRSLARAIAAEGIVLLKNVNETLPLSRHGWSQADELNHVQASGKYRIAVIGEDSRKAAGGPNVCPDRACNKGTLATGWGSGAVEFPYLITPLEAIQSAFNEETVAIKSYPTNQLPSTIRNDTSIEEQDLCIVFVNADGGEGFREFEGIKGDRNDIKLQHHGDALITDVAARCGRKRQESGEEASKSSSLSGTIVVIHSVGPVLVESFIDSPNVRAVLQANLPGQESGHALTDVLLGDINPSGHLPYTMGRSLKAYGPGAQVKYYPNRLIPQQSFSEGLLIDYRWFDDRNTTPRFPFGYGLSYSTFALRDLQIIPLNPFAKPDLFLPPRPADESRPPTYSPSLPDVKEVIWPEPFRRLKKYVYPYIIESEATKATTAFFTKPPKHISATAPDRYRSPAGGGQGGHPALWEVLATVEVTVVNTGPKDGQAVVQLYVRFPQAEQFEDGDALLDPNSESNSEIPTANASKSKDKITFPKRVLRAFEKVHTYADPGIAQRDSQLRKSQHPQGSWEFSTKRVKMELTRRDLSYWSVRRQSWVLPDGGFEIDVGFSAGDLPVSGRLW